jgi:hypothetical protein
MVIYPYTTGEIEAAFIVLGNGAAPGPEQYEIVNFWRSLPEQDQSAILERLSKGAALELCSLATARTANELEAVKEKAARSGIAALDDREYRTYMRYINGHADEASSLVTDPSVRASVRHQFALSGERTEQNRIWFLPDIMLARINTDLDEIERRSHLRAC